MAYIEREEKNQTGDCTCEGRLAMEKDGTCRLWNKTKMAGTSGTGTGVVQMQLFAEDGTVLFKEETVLTVGSDFLRGINRKEISEDFNIDKDVLKKTKFVAFRSKAYETSGWDNEWVKWALVAAVVVAAVYAGGWVAVGGGWIVIGVSFEF